MIRVLFDTGNVTRWLHAFSPRLQALLRKQLVAGLAEVGSHLTGKMTAASPRGSSVTLRRSHRQKVSERELSVKVFNSAKYALFVHEGTKHGKMPPPKELEPWVKRVLKVPEKEKKAVAFLVARSILRRGGLPARPWMLNVFVAEQREVQRIMRSRLARFVRAARAAI